jgi:hypothetical protein
VPLREVGAGVDHRVVEKEAVERVRHVVVIGDVGLVGGRASVPLDAVARHSLERARHPLGRAPERGRDFHRFDAEALKPSADLALRPPGGEIEECAVPQVQETGHVGVDQRVEGRPAHQRRDDALRADDEAHGIVRQVARHG